MTKVLQSAYLTTYCRPVVLHHKKHSIFHIRTLHAQESCSLHIWIPAFVRVCPRATLSPFTTHTLFCSFCGLQSFQCSKRRASESWRGPASWWFGGTRSSRSNLRSHSLSLALSLSLLVPITVGCSITTSSTTIRAVFFSSSIESPAASKATTNGRRWSTHRSQLVVCSQTTSIGSFHSVGDSGTRVRKRRGEMEAGRQAKHWNKQKEARTDGGELILAGFLRHFTNLLLPSTRESVGIAIDHVAKSAPNL